MSRNKNIIFQNYRDSVEAIISARPDKDSEDCNEVAAYYIDQMYELGEYDKGTILNDTHVSRERAVRFLALEYDLTQITEPTTIELAIKADGGWFDAGQEAYIDWGDATTLTVVSATSDHTGYIGHTYASAGTYTIKISGSMKMYGRDSNVDILGQELLTRVDSFGKLGITSVDRAFYNCDGLMAVPKTLPDSVTTMYSMFRNCSGAAFNPDVSNWDVSNVTDMSSMFYNCSGAAFNPDVSNWDVSNVTNMAYMFYNCSGAAFNPDVSNWDVSNVTSMTGMFYGCSGAAFNPDVTNWKVSNATDMTRMFRNCSGAAFNPDVSKWNVSKVTDMRSMFRACYGAAFNPDVSKWNVSKVTDMVYMFSNCSGAAFNPDMKSWTLKTGVITTDMFTGSKTQPTTWLDELLIAWAANSEQDDNITIDFSPNSFTAVEGAPLQAVADALAALTAKGWSITTANPYPAT